MSELYYIATDDAGQPYIAHSGENRRHKYFLKITINGRTRYFYSKNEVDAYYKRQKQGIQENKGKEAKAKSNGPSPRSMSSRTQPQYKPSLLGDRRLRNDLKNAKRELKEAERMSAPDPHGKSQPILDLDEYFIDEKKRKEKEKRVTAAQKKVNRARTLLNDNRSIDDIPRNLYSTGINSLWRR